MVLGDFQRGAGRAVWCEIPTAPALDRYEVCERKDVAVLTVDAASFDARSIVGRGASVSHRTSHRHVHAS